MDADEFVLFEAVYDHVDHDQAPWQERHVYCKGGHGLAFDAPGDQEGRPFRWKLEDGKVVYRMCDEEGDLPASVWLVDKDEVQEAYAQCIGRMVTDGT